MSIGDCPNWPECGHKSMGQCDADILGNRDGFPKQTHVPAMNKTKPMIYLAYRVSTRYHYGESSSETHEHLLDADADQFALIKRVNEHFAQSDTIRFERGTKHEIPAFSTVSKPTYMPGGGGTDYTARIEIRKAPTLVKTHRAREALWYGKRDANGAFAADQKFGDWFPITAEQANSYAERENYQVERLEPKENAND